MKQIKNLPDIFTFFDGRKVENKADWEERRAELVEYFTHNVYGEYDESAKEGFTFDIVSDEANDRFRKKVVMMKKEGWEGEFYVWTPTNRPKAPVIVYCILQGYEDDPNRKFDLNDVDGYKTAPSISTLPIGYLLDRGYAVAAYYVSRAAKDKPGGEDTQMNAMLVKEKTPTSARAIAAWSFYAKRILDYLETDADVDATRVAMTGHSRGGKTALYTAATDERFKFAYVSNSGCTGAAIARENTGETIEKINKVFPHWFTENYKAYDNREDEFPVDFHELVACVAPRQVLVSSSSKDWWACPENEFASAKIAGEVWEKFYGMKGLVSPDEPELDVAYNEGNVAYHIKTGAHSFDYSDWIKCLEFLDKQGWRK